MSVRWAGLVGAALLAALGCGDDAPKAGHGAPTPDGGAVMDAGPGRDHPHDAAVAHDANMGDASQHTGDAGQQAGDAAQQGADPCAPNPCEHGGTCAQADAGAVCACAPGFEGTHCEQDIDECASNPCVHATGCTDAVADFTCTCEDGWDGKLCDHDIDECAANVCVHATGCTDSPGDFTCACEPGWFGKTCSTSCDDHDASTVDSLHPVYGCAHRKGDVTKFNSGLYGDHTTGLGWWVLAGLPGYEETKTACADLVVAGHDDFRLPTIGDVRSLAAYCPATAPGGTCPISDPTCLTQSCGYGTTNECASCIGGPSNTSQNPNGYYCRTDVPFCMNWWTSSPCSDCAPGHVWFYGVINGNFYHTETTNGGPAACVTPLSDL